MVLVYPTVCGRYSIRHYYFLHSFYTFVWAQNNAVIVIFQQEELEHLNEASAEINRLELQLDVSNTKTVFHPLKGI